MRQPGVTVLLLSILLAGQAALLDRAWPQASESKESRPPGVPPLARGQCPPSHPLKGNFTTYSGERCIYHLPGQRYYGKTNPERCYATEEDAQRDGCRRSKV